MRYRLLFIMVLALALPASAQYTNPGGGGGTGTVDTSGTPVANDYARFTDADTIEGRSYAEALGDLGAESATSNDIDPDRLNGDDTDDNKVDQDIMEGFGASADPAIVMKDSDASDGDDNYTLDIDATATGSGAEDIDITEKIQIGGAETTVRHVDASENTYELGGATVGSQINLAAGSDVLSDDDWSGITLNGWNCGEAVAQWDAVYLDDTSNEWMVADADSAGEWPSRGIAVTACTDGNPGIILVQGMARNDGWTWAANGATLFLGDGGTGSTVTATAPSTSGDCVQVLGFAVNDDQVYFNFSGHYLEVE